MHQSAGPARPSRTNGRCAALARAARATLETLEERRLLAVVINEIVASNTKGLTDLDGQHSDWLELRNTGPSTVNIGGWYLTDEAANKTKWQFPSPTNIVAGGYLVVFASEKNLAGPELHANFSLASAGEYLGLVQSDGTTVASEYNPFPAQEPDTSYGVAVTSGSSTNVTLVGASSALTVISPTAENAAVDDNWRNVGFNDSGWLTGTRSIGFDRNTDGTDLTPYIGRTLSAAEMPAGNTRPTAYLRYAFNVTDKDQLTALSLALRFDDGFVAFINGHEVKRVNVGENFQKPQLQWNTSAGYMLGTGSSIGATNRGAESTTQNTFDLTPYLDDLVNGTNVLAFHVANSGSGSDPSKDDLLLEPILTATRANGAATDNYYMVSPTPNANNGVGVQGLVADTQFSVDRGFFTASFPLDITTLTPGSTIKYTLDGSEPTLTNGSTYSGTITINPPANGNAGVVTVRAAAFKTGYRSTNVDTQSYVFLDKVILQNGTGLGSYGTWGVDKEDADATSGYNLDDESDWSMDPDIVTNPTYSGTIINDLKSIPTMSVVMNWNDLFGATAQPGTPAGSGAVAPAPQGIYIHGRSDERRASVEYFNPNNLGEQFQINSAIEIQGHSSPKRWSTDKLSFEIKFKPPYGAEKLNYPIFVSGLYGDNAANDFDGLVLDAGFNNTWLHSNNRQYTVARYITDQAISDFQNLAGGQAPHGRFVHLYLNGLYWGIYNVHEKANDSFAEEYYGGDKDNYDVVKHASDDPVHKFTWVDGGVNAETNYLDLLTKTRTLETTPNATNYAAIANILDVKDFIDYMVVHYYGGNIVDWSNNNWYASRDRVTAGAKWHFHAWDQEHAFPTNDNAGLGDTVGQNVDLTTEDFTETPTEIHKNLMAFSEYRVAFSDEVQRLMQNNGLLTPTTAAAIYNTRANEIDRAIVGESARWGDNRVSATPFTRTNFNDIKNAILTDFFPVRTGYLLDQFTPNGTFTTNDWLVSLEAPIYGQYGGSISSGFQLTLTKPGGSPGGAVIYYTTDGSDPRVYDPLTGNVSLSPTATLYSGPITLNASTRVKARIFFNNTGTANDWSAIEDRTFILDTPFPVRITELHYNPAAQVGVTNSDDIEFIELMNTGSQTVSLQGVQITQFSSTPYTFGNVSLTAGQRIIVARDPSVFQQVYGTGINLAATGYTPANLSNGGERVVLLGPFGETLQDFTYDDVGPWPTTPDGLGPSLEIIDPLGDPTNAANWRASSTNGGSPGSAGGPSDTTPPAVTGASFTYATGHKFLVQFSEAINVSTLSATDLVLTGGLNPNSVTFDTNTNTATFVFNSPIANNAYTATLAAGSVSDIAGNLLSGGLSYNFIWATGTAASDSFKVGLNPGGTIVQVYLNSASPTYTATLATLNQIVLDGAGGSDSIEVLGSTGNDAVSFNADTLSFNPTVDQVNVESFKFDGGGGTDTLSIDTVKVALSSTPKLSSLNLTAGGTLDILNFGFALDYSSVSPIGTWNGGAYTQLTGFIASGRNEGSWDGVGIISSLADGSGYTAVGIASSNEALGLTGDATDTWAGHVIDASTVLVKYTYGGDANLSGTVDVDDYGQIDFNASTGGVLTGWFNGDFDFTGTQDVDDYGIIDFVVGIQGPPL